jgi:hypothetical protein
MMHKVDVTLSNGTLVRHKNRRYEGTIDGITEIKACFTRGGAQMTVPNSKDVFQYRVAVLGESMRYVAPIEDLEIVQAAEIPCVRCQRTFKIKPALVGKPGGRCACGGWICTACMGCQADDAANDKARQCPAQRKRFLKLAAKK